MNRIKLSYVLYLIYVHDIDIYFYLIYEHALKVDMFECLKNFVFANDMKKYIVTDNIDNMSYYDLIIAAFDPLPSLFIVRYDQDNMI